MDGEEAGVGITHLPHQGTGQNSYFGYLQSWKIRPSVIVKGMMLEGLLKDSNKM